MTTVYAKTRWLPLCALMLGCGTTAPASVPSWHPTTQPGVTLDAFVDAWNGGDRGVVLATFEPERRLTIDADPIFSTRLAAWKALQHHVRDECNPRGTYWKTAVVTFQDRRSGAPVEEIVWIHLRDGGWWMYSL